MPPVPATAADLIAFAAELAGICREGGYEPIAYGSLAYAVHAGDWSAGLNDVDLLAPEPLFPALAERCLTEGSLSAELTTYHTLKIIRGGLKVSFDSLDHYLDGIAPQPSPAIFAGHTLLVLGRSALIEAYRRGADTIPAKRQAYLAKLSRLAAAD